MEKPEYYVVHPSIKLFGGVKVTKETDFDIYNDDKSVHQVLKDLKLVTEITRESEYNGIKSKEESKLTTEIPEGTVIIWGEDTGYIIPNYNMVKVEDAIKALEQIKDITGEIEENQRNVEKGKVYEFKTK